MAAEPARDQREPAVRARADELPGLEAREIVGELAWRSRSAPPDRGPSPCRRSRTRSARRARARARRAAAARSRRDALEHVAVVAPSNGGARRRARDTGSRRSRRRRRARRRARRAPAPAPCTPACRAPRRPRVALGVARCAYERPARATRRRRVGRSFARPQSITTVSPNAPTSTLPGLRSRWMMRSPCAYAIASATASTCGSSASRSSSVVALGDHVVAASARRRASSRRTARRRATARPRRPARSPGAAGAP